MGFEVSYSFYEKMENSFDYDKTEVKNFKKIYGKAVEDYPLEKLASAIQQQMARRDIFVFDFEIFEFQKKKISWRQNKSDLIIKNKRFTNTGQFIDIVGEDEQTDKCHPPEYDTGNVNTPNPSSQNNRNVPAFNLVNLADKNGKLVSNPVVVHHVQPERIIKYVSFMPSRMIKPVGNFTVEKTYPVYKESLNSNGIGMIIETLDDKGKRVKVEDEHFVPAGQNLLAGELFVDDKKESERLNWYGVVKEDIPSVR